MNEWSALTCWSQGAEVEHEVCTHPVPTLGCHPWLCSSCKSPRLRAGTCATCSRYSHSHHKLWMDTEYLVLSAPTRTNPLLLKTATVLLQSTRGGGGISSQEQILNVTMLMERRMCYRGVYLLWVSQCVCWVWVSAHATQSWAGWLLRRCLGRCCSVWEYFRAGWSTVLAHLFLPCMRGLVSHSSCSWRSTWFISCLASKTRISLGYGWASPWQGCEPQAALASPPLFLPMGTKSIDFGFILNTPEE